MKCYVENKYVRNQSFFEKISTNNFYTPKLWCVKKKTTITGQMISSYKNNNMWKHIIFFNLNRPTLEGESISSIHYTSKIVTIDYNISYKKIPLKFQN